MTSPDKVQPFRFCRDCEYKDICIEIPERYVFIKGSCDIYKKFQSGEEPKEISSRMGQKDIGVQLRFEGMEEKDEGR
ncbi:MAG TPA: hypothetical protein VI544_01245 [Candidatus Nanoarchaeia archaeon]|nr:hypothetical protein [Candidatus Nanoarchaeia archaeon]